MSVVKFNKPFERKQLWLPTFHNDIVTNGANILYIIMHIEYVSVCTCYSNVNVILGADMKAENGIHKISKQEFFGCNRGKKQKECIN